MARTKKKYTAKQRARLLKLIGEDCKNGRTQAEAAKFQGVSLATYLAWKYRRKKPRGKNCFPPVEPNSVTTGADCCAPPQSPVTEKEMIAKLRHNIDLISKENQRLRFFNELLYERFKGSFVDKF